MSSNLLVNIFIFIYVIEQLEIDIWKALIKVTYG